MGLATAALATMALASTYSAYNSYQNTRDAKKVQKQQQAAIRKQQAEAEEQRAGLLSIQRSQMGYDSDYTTKGRSNSILGEETLGG